MKVSAAGQKGIFTVSLDFELYWGVRDTKRLENYKKNLTGARLAIPAILKLFDEYNIHATWTIVGFLFFETRDELIKGLPAKKPTYIKSEFSPYDHINKIGNNEKEDPFHYAPSLIKTISSYPNQEIGSHTFSHYYCLEAGQDADAFREDLKAAISAAKKCNLDIESLSLPRNQFNREYMSVCKELKIKACRGNQPSWIYKARNAGGQSLLIRILRSADAYFNISGHHCYSLDEIEREIPYNIPASRFLYPYSGKLKILEPLRLRRILSSMTYAAKKGRVFHLWWHPHNFGADTDQNMAFLEKILDHYSELQKTYGMESFSMGEVARELTKKAGNGR